MKKLPRLMTTTQQHLLSSSIWFPFFIEFSLIWNNVAHTNGSPQETASLYTVTTGWHNCRKTERKVPSVFNEVPYVHSVYSMALCSYAQTNMQCTYNVCVQASKLCPNLLWSTYHSNIQFLWVQRTLMCLTILHWQVQKLVLIKR